jgi:hypothetical protein
LRQGRSGRKSAETAAAFASAHVPKARGWPRAVTRCRQYVNSGGWKP